eukprot:CAMPEP_0116548784 /NCGR_PEP_ID=MMETSP0397-20121206/4527_1 /TAXON_ID=216820 /ORGANISM="Cyclophora tenuis, Strain ECT3854" /LENGTH=214 /DNA_ID=CAMNT_0004073469 /DNA_START=74 /DNA_END=718 /DNA_ORIENTATION=+
MSLAFSMDIQPEQELVEALLYKGHELVVNSLKRRWSADADADDHQSPKKIVDLGCGTGLVGGLIREAYEGAILVGVDLSERMVQLSRSRLMKDQVTRVYNDVHQNDALGFLSALRSFSVDAVLAADVFTYIGEIEDVLNAARECLVPGGLLIFTVETTSTGMRLLPSGRFGHSEPYVQMLASRTGMNLVEWKDDVLRMQRGKNVAAAVVILEKQ